MKILYCTDNYAHNVMGTKRSIAEELLRTGHEVLTLMRTSISDTSFFLKQIASFQPDQIWFAHSALTIKPEVKNQINVPIVGFGFSDPYYFSPNRFASYDIYVTNHLGTLEKYKDMLPMHYNATACDFRFHQDLKLPKVYDVSLIGLAVHPRFHNSTERKDFVAALKVDLKDLKITAFGNGWSNPPIEGEAFLKVINESRLGLDIQDDWSPLAHRMFEYSACGTPVITRRRDEVFRFFEEGTEIIAYDEYEEFKEKVSFYCKHPKNLEKIGQNAKQRCEKEHDIKYRVQALLKFLESLS